MEKMTVEICPVDFVDSNGKLVPSGLVADLAKKAELGILYGESNYSERIAQTPIDRLLEATRQVDLSKASHRIDKLYINDSGTLVADIAMLKHVTEGTFTIRGNFVHKETEQGPIDEIVELITIDVVSNIPIPQLD